PKYRHIQHKQQGWECPVSNCRELEREEQKRPTGDRNAIPKVSAFLRRGPLGQKQVSEQESEEKELQIIQDRKPWMRISAEKYCLKYKARHHRCYQHCPSHSAVRDREHQRQNRYQDIELHFDLQRPCDSQHSARGCINQVVHIKQTGKQVPIER